MRKLTSKGKKMYIAGIWIVALGIAINPIFPILPDLSIFWASLYLPLVIIGIGLLVGSNFFRKSDW
ncbi:hypothetical protein [Evansella tamaricis]|uniref:Uncharacterized protein n=1 Tax=Evansella tamaricis TaxID=2069301 RepID=A0ABS6JNT4_9BACI|nr:hypothetical protein [Evansella tamaricis]MBU9713963.1 hypothetical protein [Evansella tamaricis]